MGETTSSAPEVNDYILGTSLCLFFFFQGFLRKKICQRSADHFFVSNFEKILSQTWTNSKNLESVGIIFFQPQFLFLHFG